MAVWFKKARTSSASPTAPAWRPARTSLDIVEQKLWVCVKFVPKEFADSDPLQDAHHWLILHGRYTCKARKPECWNCMQRGDLCDYRSKTGRRPDKFEQLGQLVDNLTRIAA